MTDERNQDQAITDEQEQDLSLEPDVEGPAEEQAPLDETAALLGELEEAKAKQAEYLDGWQRARAELANARKRFQREQEQAYGTARADVLLRFLPVLDDLERAFNTLPGELAGVPWVEGTRLIHQKLKNLLQQEGVTTIAAEGQEFDPALHQAVTHEPSGTVAEGQVISELQKGYRLGDRVLRPSMVRVSSGPVAATEAAGGHDQEPA